MVLMGIIYESTYNYLLVNNLLFYERKVSQKNSQDTKDHLSIDKTVLKNCNRQCRNLCVA